MNPKFYKRVFIFLSEVPESLVPYDKIAQVRMTGVEYYELFSKKNIAEQKVSWMTRKIEELKNIISKLAESKKKFEDFVPRAKAAMEKMQEALNFKDEQIKELEDSLAVSENRNKNLIRIVREKANKDRGLPRKFDGYMVINSRQVKQVYDTHDSADYREKAEAIVWKTTIQSPYKADMEPLNSVEDLILTDIFDTYLVLPEMGCPLMNTKRQNGEYEAFFEGDGVNAAYLWQFNRNIKSGYYEIDVYTKDELHIPKYRFYHNGGN